MTPIRPWYKQKRYIIIFGTLAMAILGSLGADNTPSQRTPINRVKTDIILNKAKIPALPIGSPTQITPPTTKKPANISAPATQNIVTPPALNTNSGLSNDNYYTNTAGNAVHSPAHSPSVPAGASARCRDGTYSFSQSRRGACSHHGGVAEWL